MVIIEIVLDKNGNDILDLGEKEGRGMARQLRILGERHREMVRLEMEGKGRKEIGEAIGMNAQVVGRVLLHDEKAEEYRRELVKEKERELKEARVRAELILKGYVEDFVKQIHKIAFYGDTDAVKLNACIKGLQFGGMKLEGKEEGMVKAPRIIIRYSDEKIERDELAKSIEAVVDNE